MSRKSILIVDDEANVGTVLALHLRSLGLSVTTCVNADSAMNQLSQSQFDLVLTDLVMPRRDGLWLLKQIQQLTRPPLVLLMSAHADAELAMRALEEGAFDYVPKPFRPEEVLFRVRRALERVEILGELEVLRQNQFGHHSKMSSIITRSKNMQDLLAVVMRVAPYKTTVLITGESGTGKELIARALHEHGDRASRPFVAVNCGAIPEHLLESELFGHKKGAFTDAVSNRVGLFEQANGGTLFLDEIGELPLQVQVKLLRVLQEGQIRRVGESIPSPVDVRIVAATVRNLKEAVSQRAFREDLFYRLNVMPIQLPPLRDRNQDVPLLVEHFFSFHRENGRTDVQLVRKDAMLHLMNHDWPGNVRELQNLVERLSILVDGDELAAHHLPQHIIAKGDEKKLPTPRPSSQYSPHNGLKAAMQDVERDLLIEALAETEGNRTRAARLLKVSHRSLLYKIKAYGIE